MFDNVYHKKLCYVYNIIYMLLCINIFILLDHTYRLPKSNVDLVSDSLKDAGEQQIMIVVRAFPPKDS